jgi:hypothetical protein
VLDVVGRDHVHDATHEVLADELIMNHGQEPLDPLEQPRHASALVVQIVGCGIDRQKELGQARPPQRAGSLSRQRKAVGDDRRPHPEMRSFCYDSLEVVP